MYIYMDMLWCTAGITKLSLICRHLCFTIVKLYVRMCIHVYVWEYKIICTCICIHIRMYECIYVFAFAERLTWRWIEDRPQFIFDVGRVDFEIRVECLIICFRLDFKCKNLTDKYVSYLKCWILWHLLNRLLMNWR